MDKETAKQIVNGLKIPHYHRDLMIMTGGLGFIICTNVFYFHNSLSNLFSFCKNFLTWETSILILALSYIVGRMLLVLEQITSFIYTFFEYYFSKYTIFHEQPKQILQRFKSERALWLRNFFNTLFASKSITLRELENVTTIAETEAITDKYPGMVEDFERRNLSNLFLKMLSSTLLLGSLFVSPILICIFFIIFYLTILGDLNSIAWHEEIAKAAIKERGTKDTGH